YLSVSNGADRPGTSGGNRSGQTAKGRKMKLTTLLKKHFDIEECTDVDSTVNREVYTIWVYEKGEDCEPLLILKDAQDLMGVDGWLVGNIYSTLQHGLLLQHEQLKTMIRNGEIKSSF
ncbi:hypothetical protein OW930_28135, partial [Klebsiella pneumoniae]